MEKPGVNSEPVNNQTTNNSENVPPRDHCVSTSVLESPDVPTHGPTQIFISVTFSFSNLS